MITDVRGHTPVATTIMEDHLMSREPTERTCLTFKSRQLEALRDLARETGAPVAELARRAVDSFLTAHVNHRIESDRPGPTLANPGPTTSISD
jgi:hypothetical protein